MNIKKAQTNVVPSGFEVPTFVKILNAAGLIPNADIPRNIGPLGAATNYSTAVASDIGGDLRLRIAGVKPKELNTNFLTYYKNLPPVNREQLDNAVHKAMSGYAGKSVSLTDLVPALGENLEKANPRFIDKGIADLIEAGKPVAAARRFTGTPKPVATSTPGLTKNQSANDTVVLGFMDKDGSYKAEVIAEIADTPDKRRLGLSNRLLLPEGCGMLFDKVGAYWMKDVDFPLDILFLDEKGTVLEKQHMPVVRGKSAEELPRYLPRTQAAHALELPSGWFDKKGLAIGDRVKVLPLNFYRTG